MASPVTSKFSDIIDWTEAMEQCGDDEDFLPELLSDLRDEIDEQIVKIDEVLKVSDGNHAWTLEEMVSCWFPQSHSLLAFRRCVSARGATIAR